ncbi:MAG: S8 family serine peptidase [Bdellovibrionota bacterium]
MKKPRVSVVVMSLAVTIISIAIAVGCAGDNASADAPGLPRDAGVPTSRVPIKRFQCSSKKTEWGCEQEYCKSEKGQWDEKKKECEFPSSANVSNSIGSLLRRGAGELSVSLIGTESQVKEVEERLRPLGELQIPVTSDGFGVTQSVVRHSLSLSFGVLGPYHTAISDLLNDPAHFYSMKRSDPFMKISHVVHEPIIDYMPYALGDFRRGAPDESFFYFKAPKLNAAGKLTKINDRGEYSSYNVLTDAERSKQLPDQRSIDQITAALSYFTVRMRFSPDQIETVSIEACADHCIARQKLDLGMVDLFEAEWVKAYGRGRVLTQYVSVNRKDALKTPVMAVFYNFGGGVSHVITFKTEDRAPAFQPKFLAYVFDRFGEALSVSAHADGELVGVDSYSSPYSSIGFMKSLDVYKMAKSKTKDGSAKVAVCEFGFPWLPSSPLLSKVAFGPHVTDPKGRTGSQLGWFANPEGSLDAFFDSRSALGWFNGGGTNDHSKAVVEVLTRSAPAVEFAPISEESCFRKIDEWQPWASQEELKVVNVSLVGTGRREVCHKTAYGQAVLNTEKELLWVVAAGNFREWSGDYPELDCPQTLGIGKGQKNLLIVAATEGESGRLLEISHRGSDYADIAASGSFFDNSMAAGTSFAAPRVSAPLGEVAFQYPRLLPEDLRMAAILSAKIPASGPLPVRSGGVLNRVGLENVARQMARLSADERALIGASRTGNKIVSDLVKQAFCVGARVECEEAKEKIEVLQKNGVLK